MYKAHQPGPKFGDQLRRLGYYWLKMIPDAIAYAKWCHACQTHGDFVHQALEHLRTTFSSWPFEMWGMDIIGPISPPTSRGHRFILVITDYFSKWAKATPWKKKRHQMWSSSSSITCSTASAYHDESSTITEPNSSAKHSSDFVTNSESKVHHQRQTIQLLMAWQKPSTRLLESFSRNSSRRVNVTE